MDSAKYRGNISRVTVEPHVPHGDSAPASATAISRRRVGVALLVLAIVVAADQISKWWVVENLAPRTPYPVVGDVFRLFLIRNPGAAFSFGTSWTFMFAIIQATAVVIALVAAWRTRSTVVAIIAGLIGGGAAGNLLDRIFRYPGGGSGHVVDFLSFGSFAIFNVADTAITIGVAAYVLYSFLGAGDSDAAEPAGPSVEEMKR